MFKVQHDLGVLANTLPGYYGLKPGSWAHWARVWEEDLDWLKGRFGKMKKKDGKDLMMNEKGIPVSRWIDGVLESKENLVQPDNTRAMVFWGHAPNSQTRMVEMKDAMEKLDLLVVVDPFLQFQQYYMIEKMVLIYYHQRLNLRLTVQLQPQIVQFNGEKRLWNLCLRGSRIM